MIVNSILISAITLSGKTTVSIHAGETDISAESEEDQQIPHSEALTDWDCKGIHGKSDTQQK